MQRTRLSPLLCSSFAVPDYFQREWQSMAMFAQEQFVLTGPQLACIEQFPSIQPALTVTSDVLRTIVVVAKYERVEI